MFFLNKYIFHIYIYIDIKTLTHKYNYRNISIKIYPYMYEYIHTCLLYYAYYVNSLSKTYPIHGFNIFPCSDKKVCIFSHRLMTLFYIKI